MSSNPHESLRDALREANQKLGQVSRLDVLAQSLFGSEEGSVNSWIQNWVEKHLQVCALGIAVFNFLEKNIEWHEYIFLDSTHAIDDEKNKEILECFKKESSNPPTKYLSKEFFAFLKGEPQSNYPNMVKEGKFVFHFSKDDIKNNTPNSNDSPAWFAMQLYQLIKPKEVKSNDISTFVYHPMFTIGSVAGKGVDIPVISLFFWLKKIDRSEPKDYVDEEAKQFQPLAEYIHSNYLGSYALRKQLTAEEKTTQASIMARNFSHNVGSHVLSNSHLYSTLGIDSKLDGCSSDYSKRRLERFHSYMQGRLDFLARSISGGNCHVEPLYFIGDLLNGFFQQGVLLDTLLQDMGVDASRLQFEVKVKVKINGDSKNGNDDSHNKSEPITFSYKDVKPTKEVIDKFFQPDKRAFKDVLVGVPGGMVGRHAFYAFMENVMRNAVKYNSESVKKAGKIKFTLTLHSCSGGRVEANDGECYILTIGDNISKKPEVVNQVRDYLDKELLTEEGEINHEGHGITEMRLCAEELSGGLRFAPDDGHCENCNERNKDKSEYGCDASKDYVEIIPSPEEQEGNKKRITKHHALRAYLTGRKNSTKKEFLTYDLLLPKPKLLGIVGANFGADHETTKANGVYYYGNISDLAHSGVYFGVVLGDDLESDERDAMNKLLKEIAEKHPSLPFRLLVLTGCKEKKEVWKKCISDMEKSNEVPTDRVRVIVDSKLYSALNDVKANEESFLGCSGWGSLLLRVYDAWLRAYKPTENGRKWPLYIGFQRNDLSDKWKKNQWDECSVISLHAHNVKSGNTIPVSEKHAIVFDNHGQCFMGNENEYSFYQKFGSQECLTLYQQLEHPPEDDFAFAFMIYSLVEAALTNVVVIDERVAQSVLMSAEASLTKTIGPPLGRLYKSRVFPSFYWNDKKTPLSNEIKNLDNKLNKQQNAEPYIVSLDGNRIGGYVIDGKIDMLIIHEGVLDRMENLEKWASKTDTKKLYQLSPWVIRTSGGGSHSDQLENWVPFVEFGNIKDTIIADLNKFELVRSLAMASGMEES